MSTYTITSTSINGGRFSGNTQSADWDKYIGSGKQGNMIGWDTDTSTKWRACNILFNQSDLNAYRSKPITSITLTITAVSGKLPSSTYSHRVRYKYDAQVAPDEASSAWASSNAASSAMSTDDLALLNNGSSSRSIVANEKFNINVGTTLPKYGYVIGTGLANPNSYMKIGDTATLTIVTSESDYSYTLKYNINGGSGSVPANQTGANSGTSPSYTFDIPATPKPTRTGYRFLGWSTSKTATTASYTSGGSITVTASGTTTLYAVWQAYVVTVRYNANGGSMASSHGTGFSVDSNGYILRDGSMDFAKLAYGNSADPWNYNNASSINVVRSGYVVPSGAEWNTKANGTGTSFNQATTYAATTYAPSLTSGDQIVVLYVNWKVGSFVVSYNANGGSGAPASQVKNADVALTLSTQVPVRNGHTFLGWGTSATATTAAYQPGGIYTANADATLYAVWKQLPQDIVPKMSSKQAMYMRTLQLDYRPIIRLFLLNKDETVREEITNDLIVGGQLRCVLQNGMRRTATVTINNEDLRYTPNPNRLWFGQKFKLYAGVRLEDGSEYLVPQGVFYSSNPGASYLQSNRIATLNLVDKWAYLDGSLFGKVKGAYYIPKTVDMGSGTITTKLADAVTYTLKQDDGLGDPVDPIDPFFDTNITNVVLPYTLRSNATGSYADVMLELNKMMIGSMGYDQNGRLCVTSDNLNVDRSKQPIVWRYEDDALQLFTLDATSQMSEMYNHVYVVGATLEGDIFKGEAVCTSPKYETNVQRVGDKVLVVQDDTLYSATYAQQRAEYELKQSQRLGYQLSGSGSPQFHWYPGCLISVPPMDVSRKRKTVMITEYNLPLAGVGAMTWTGTTLI